MIALTLFFSQIDHDLIGSDIDIKSAKKDEQTQEERNGCQPTAAVVTQ